MMRVRARADCAVRPVAARRPCRQVRKLPPGAQRRTRAEPTMTPSSVVTMSTESCAPLSGTDAILGDWAARSGYVGQTCSGAGGFYASPTQRHSGGKFSPPGYPPSTALPPGSSCLVYQPSPA